MTYTWSVPAGDAITGSTRIKDTDNKIGNTVNDLVDFVNGEGSHAGQGLTYDLVDKLTAQTISGVKTFTGNIVATGGVTGDLTGNATGSSGSCTGNSATATTLSAGADRTKLDGIEAGAEVNPTNAETKTAYEANADTNAYTDTEKTKLAGIATNANNYTLPTATQTVYGGIKAYVSGDSLYITL